MAIGFRTPQTPVEQSSASSPTSVSFPTGTVAGDVLLLKCATGGTAANTVSTPAGWTSVAQLAGTANTAQPNVAEFIRVCTGTEGGSVSVTHGAVLLSAQVHAFTGADTGTPQDVAVQTIDITTASTACTFPGVTVATAGAALAYTIAALSTSVTCSPASGFTEDADRTVASSRAWETAHQLGLAAGATGSISATWSSSAKSVGILVTIRPAQVSDTASFSGSGTAGFSGQPTIAAPAGFSGSGTLALAGKPSLAAPAGFSGSGTLALVGSPTLAVGGAYSGSGTLTLAGKPSLSTAATFSGAGTLTLAGQLGGATGTFSGSGTLTLVGKPTVAAAGTFSGSGTLALAGKPSLAAPAGFSGVGTLTLAGKPTLAAGGAYSGVGTLTLAAKPTQLAGSLFTGSGQLTLDDGLLPPADITAALLFSPTLSSSDRGFNAAAGSLGRPANIGRLHVGETTWVGPVDYSPLGVDLELAVVPAGSTPAELDFDPPDLVDGRPGVFLAPSTRGTYGVWARDGRGSGSQFAVLTVT